MLKMMPTAKLAAEEAVTTRAEEIPKGPFTATSSAAASSSRDEAPEPHPIARTNGKEGF